MINKALFLILFPIILTMSISNLEAKNLHKRTIMIDLDGVLDNYTVYAKDIPEIKAGAVDFIKTLSKDYNLVLFTTRSPMSATKWLIKYDIDKYFTDVTNVKYPAYIYIDDRAINFNGDYNKTLKDIKNFKAYKN